MFSKFVTPVEDRDRIEMISRRLLILEYDKNRHRNCSFPVTMIGTKAYSLFRKAYYT